MENNITNIVYKQIEVQNQQAMKSRLGRKKTVITVLNSKFLFMGNDNVVKMHINQIIDQHQNKAK